MRFWVTLAVAIIAGGAAAQERVSLVSGQVQVGGEVQRSLNLGMEDLRSLARRRGFAVAGGYGGVRLTELLLEADIRQVSLADERPGVRHVKWLSRIEVKRLPE